MEGLLVTEMWGRATKTNRAETGACRAIMWSRSGDVDVLLLNMRCATPPAASGWYCPCLRDQAFLTSSVVFRSYLILVSFIMLKNRGLLFPDQRAAVQEKIRNPKISKYILLSRYLLAFPGPFFSGWLNSRCFFTDVVLHVRPPDILPPRIWPLQWITTSNETAWRTGKYQIKYMFVPLRHQWHHLKASIHSWSDLVEQI